MKTQW